MNKLCTLVAAATTACLATTAHAAVVSGSVTGGTAGGTFVELDPLSAFSVGDDTFDDNNLYAFNEDQNITLGSPLAIDTAGGTIAAGTVIASHYVFFDPGPTRSLIGSVTFDADILGVATSTTNLAASDFLITNSVTYLNPSLRGLEAGQDFISFSGKTLSVDFLASTPGDYIRVFTGRSAKFGDNIDPSVVPLPAAGLLLFGALGGLSFLRRRASP